MVSLSGWSVKASVAHDDVPDESGNASPPIRNRHPMIRRRVDVTAPATRVVTPEKSLAVQRTQRGRMKRARQTPPTVRCVKDFAFISRGQRLFAFGQNSHVIPSFWLVGLTSLSVAHQNAWHESAPLAGCRTSETAAGNRTRANEVAVGKGTPVCGAPSLAGQRPTRTSAGLPFSLSHWLLLSGWSNPTSWC